MGLPLLWLLHADNSRSEALVHELEKRFPQDTSVRFSYLPALDALLALNNCKAAKAFSLLEAVGPYELGAPNSSMHGFFGAIIPLYLCGEVYLAMNEGAEAAAEFQKILAATWPGVTLPSAARRNRTPCAS